MDMVLTNRIWEQISRCDLWPIPAVGEVLPTWWKQPVVDGWNFMAAVVQQL